MFNLANIAEDLIVGEPEGEVIENLFYPSVHILPLDPFVGNIQDVKEMFAAEHYVKNIQPLYHVPYEAKGNDVEHVVGWFARVKSGAVKKICPVVCRTVRSHGIEYQVRTTTRYVDIYEKLMERMVEVECLQDVMTWMFLNSPVTMISQPNPDLMAYADMMHHILFDQAQEHRIGKFEFTFKHPASISVDGTYGGFNPFFMHTSNNGYSNKPLPSDGTTLLHAYGKMAQQ